MLRYLKMLPAFTNATAGLIRLRAFVRIRFKSLSLIELSS
jgi:hypothetical protein